MRGVAGLLFRDADRPVDDRALNRLAAGVGSREDHHAVRGGGAALMPVGDGAWSERVGDVVVVGDLDVSNAPEVLAGAGCASIGAALVERYRRDGAGFAKCLRGGFALALWFPDRRRVILAADRFGFRRMYYAARADGVAFGPRLENALALGAAGGDIDPAAVYAYLNFGTIPAPQSMYRAVKRLAPGHILVWQDGAVSSEPYWDVVYTEVERRSRYRRGRSLSRPRRRSDTRSREPSPRRRAPS